MAVWPNLRRWLYRDAYTLAGWFLFLLIFVFEWRNYVRKHEAIYMLGSRRVFDPAFLAGDLSWSTLPPTTFLFDHLLTPLWWLLGDFGIAVTGRLVSWFFMAWSLLLLARKMRLPPWSLLAGFALWMLWDQSFVFCGQPFEGFQPKSLAYALSLFAITAVLDNAYVRAGLLSGIATVLHIIIGGWSFLALGLAMLLCKKQYSFRNTLIFGASAAPLIVPLVLSVAWFHSGQISAEQQALMDEIYVTFAQPHCCDPEFFMSDSRWLTAAVVFPLSIIAVAFWPEKGQGRLLASYTAMLIVFFFLGILAGSLDLYFILKVYPFQLANAIPALFLFIFALAYPARFDSLTRGAMAAGAASLVACLWLLIDAAVVPDRIRDVSGRFVRNLEFREPSLYGKRLSTRRKAAYRWIRENTAPDAVFITPYLPGFWTYTAREQVAAFRHPPHDVRIIDWKERLVALNGGRPFEKRGFNIREVLSDNQRRLAVSELDRIRDSYGATHYLTRSRRTDLDKKLIFTNNSYFIYALTDNNR